MKHWVYYTIFIYPKRFEDSTEPPRVCTLVNKGYREHKMFTDEGYGSEGVEGNADFFNFKIKI